MTPIEKSYLRLLALGLALLLLNSMFSMGGHPSESHGMDFVKFLNMGLVLVIVSFVYWKNIP